MREKFSTIVWLISNLWSTCFPCLSSSSQFSWRDWLPSPSPSWILRPCQHHHLFWRNLFSFHGGPRLLYFVVFIYIFYCSNLKCKYWRSSFLITLMSLSNGSFLRASLFCFTFPSDFEVWYLGWGRLYSYSCRFVVKIFLKSFDFWYRENYCIPDLVQLYNWDFPTITFFGPWDTFLQWTFSSGYMDVCW